MRPKLTMGTHGAWWSMQLLLLLLTPNHDTSPPSLENGAHQGFQTASRHLAPGLLLHGAWLMPPPLTHPDTHALIHTHIYTQSHSLTLSHIPHSHTFHTHTHSILSHPLTRVTSQTHAHTHPSHITTFSHSPTLPCILSHKTHTIPHTVTQLAIHFLSPTVTHSRTRIPLHSTTHAHTFTTLHIYTARERVPSTHRGPHPIHSTGTPNHKLHRRPHTTWRPAAEAETKGRNAS